MLFIPPVHEKITALMPIFCKKTSILYKKSALKTIFSQKNVHSLKNAVFPCHFFLFVKKKPPAVMPIFGQKNVAFVKTTIY